LVLGPEGKSQPNQGIGAEIRAKRCFFMPAWNFRLLGYMHFGKLAELAGPDFPIEYPQPTRLN
jgi:hypothetical protein